MPELEVLKYLKKQGSTNTFRLARDLGMDRHHLLNIINRLEAKGALIVKSGVVQFLRFLPEEKKKASQKPKKISKPKKVAKVKKSRKIAKPKILQSLQSENEQLKEKLIELEENIKKLEKKASAAPKTITKTIVKKVPTPTSPPPKKKKKAKKKVSQKKLKTKKFKFPKFKFTKYIKKLKKPKFVKGGEK